MVHILRKEMTAEQRMAFNTKQREKYNERKAAEKAAEVEGLREQLDLSKKESAALRSALKESNPGAGSRKTEEGGIKKTGQQARRGRRGDNERQNEG